MPEIKVTIKKLSGEKNSSTIFQKREEKKIKIPKLVIYLAIIIFLIIFLLWLAIFLKIEIKKIKRTDRFWENIRAIFFEVKESGEKTWYDLQKSLKESDLDKNNIRQEEIERLKEKILEEVNQP